MSEFLAFGPDDFPLSDMRITKWEHYLRLKEQLLEEIETQKRVGPRKKDLKRYQQKAESADFPLIDRWRAYLSFLETFMMRYYASIVKEAIEGEICILHELITEQVAHTVHALNPNSGHREKEWVTREVCQREYSLAKEYVRDAVPKQTTPANTVFDDYYHPVRLSLERHPAFRETGNPPSAPLA